MYLSFYNLTEKPFQISTDPKFLWLGEKHKEALAILKYGIMDNRGFLLLSGDVGTGKTTLINELINSLGSKTVVATVPDPCLEILDFYNFIAYAFKMNKRFHSKGDFIIYFTDFLHHAYDRGKKVLMIIDEAQRLSHELLEEIRLLSNIEKQNTKLINIFFVGQNEFNDILLNRENRALRQRITINYNIDPLSEDETNTYINHRLKIAGSKKKLFTQDAFHEIILFSKGNPRLVNICCDHALLTGYVSGKKKINGHIIKECIAELLIKRQNSQNKQHEVPIETNQNIIVPQKKRPESPKTLYPTIILFLTVITGALIYLSITVYSIKRTEPDKLPSVYRSVIHKISKAKNLSKTSSSEKKLSYIPLTEQKTVAKEKDNKPVKKENSPSTLIDKRKNQAQKNISISGRKDKKDTVISDSRPDKSTLPEGKIFYILFGYNSNKLDKDAYSILDHLTEAMIQDPLLSIVIKGYTDRSGRYLYNKKLSEFRANIVKSYFMGKGVNPARIKTRGMGPAEPDKGKNLKSGPGFNRRVEIEIKLTQP